MKLSMEIIEKKVNALSKRERIIMSAAIGIVLFGLFDYALFTPMDSERITKNKETIGWQKEIEDVTKELWNKQSLFTNAKQERENASKLKEQIDTSKQKIQSLVSQGEQIKDVTYTLKTLLNGYKNIGLSKLDIKNPTVISTDSNYIIPMEYVIELEVSGDYLDLLDYLKQIQNQLPFLRWKNTSMEYIEDSNQSKLNINFSHFQNVIKGNQ